MRIPVRIQMTAGENGAAALYMMLGYFGKYVSISLDVRINMFPADDLIIIFFSSASNAVS